MKSARIKRAAAVIIIFAFMLSLAACGKESLRPADEIISELIDGYGYCGTRDDKDTDALIKELTITDSETGELWQKILDYWRYVEEDMTVNPDSLPEELPEDESLCIVVLGFELNSNGTMKDELLGRLQVALDCAQQYPNAYVLCTGGGTASENKSATEAELMGHWLIKKGISKNRVIVENESLSTVQNARFSMAILKSEYPQVDSVAIVSSSYHIPWGSLLFEAEFLKEAGGSEEEIHVISNAAYETTNENYRDTMSFEANGLRSLFGIR